MKGALALFGGTCVVALAACGPAPAPRARAGAADDVERVRAFEQTEDEVLRTLAAIDRRIAVRARVAPREEDLRGVTMGAVLAEDPTLAVVDGAIDPFSFEARARGLAAAREKLTPTAKELPRAAPGMTPLPAFEREVLLRLLAAEELRLEEERDLPRSASSLIRAIVDTWATPATPAQAAERDRWLARRLSQVRSSLGKPEDGGLDLVRARELDDVLDALERLVDTPGLNGATAELVKLRDALEAQGARPAMKPRNEWPLLAKRLKAHFGVVPDPAALDRRLAAAETKLRAAAEAAVVASRLDADTLGARVSAAMFGAAPCVDAVVGSRVRSMAPPPERSAACRLRHAITTSADPISRAVTFATMHDFVVAARWALAGARGEGTIAELAARHRVLARTTPDAAARLERAALAHPVDAIGAGIGAAMLLEFGDAAVDPASPGDTRLIVGGARAWTALGEVPLDVAERELSRSARRDEAKAQ